MEGPSPKTITRLLNEWGKGSKTSLDKVVGLLYTRLYVLAKKTMQGEFSPNKKDLRTADLIHEAYLEFVKLGHQSFSCREDFYRLAARIMKTVLLSLARNKSRLKRGGDHELLQLSGDFQSDASIELLDQIILLDDLLNRLKERDPRAEEVITLRFYASFTIPEIARALGISEATVKRKWDFSRAWLQKQMENPGS